MTTPINPTTPPSGEDPKKPRKPRGPLDAATLDQLDTDEQVILGVRQQMTSDPAFTGKLAPHFLDAENTVAITPASVATLAGQAASARATAAAAMSASASHGDITDG